MRVDKVGDPMPASLEEVREVFGFIGEDPGNCWAEVFRQDPGEPTPYLQGWRAMVFTWDGKEVFETCGFETVDALKAALSGAGIPEGDIETNFAIPEVTS